MNDYKNITQQKNLAWYLPRPKPDYYKGGMPLYAEEWLLSLASNILNDNGDFFQMCIRKNSLLSLFCGMNKFGTRVDIKKEVHPDYCGDVHKLSEFLPEQEYNVILADPPYSNEESKEIYGTGKLNYKKWTMEADKYLRKGGLLIVYHKYVMPNPNPEKYKIIKRVFIGNRTYHLPRVAIFFQKIK